MNSSKTIQYVFTVFITTWGIWGLTILNLMNVVELYLPTTFLIVLGT